MNKDEIDLSAYPNYLRVPVAAEEDQPAETTEGVARGLAYAALAGLIGMALAVAVSRQTLLDANLDTMMGAVTCGAMVLLYRRGAKAPPRRGLVPLAVLLLVVLVLGYVAILAARAWWVYTLLDEALGMPMSRSAFIGGMFTDREFFSWNLLLPFILSSVAGGCLALWKVRRPTEA